MNGPHARRDRLTARIRSIEDGPDHLRREHQRVASGSTEIPDATAELVRRGGMNAWRVACPFCGRSHRHGASETGAPPLGTRQSHCVSPFAGERGVQIGRAMAMSGDDASADEVLQALLDSGLRNEARVYKL